MGKENLLSVSCFVQFLFHSSSKILSKVCRSASSILSATQLSCSLSSLLYNEIMKATHSRALLFPLRKRTSYIYPFPFTTQNCYYIGEFLFKTTLSLQILSLCSVKKGYILITARRIYWWQVDGWTGRFWRSFPTLVIIWLYNFQWRGDKCYLCLLYFRSTINTNGKNDFSYPLH